MSAIDDIDRVAREEYRRKCGHPLVPRDWRDAGYVRPISQENLEFIYRKHLLERQGDSK